MIKEQREQYEPLSTQDVEFLGYCLGFHSVGIWLVIHMQLKLSAH